MMFKFSFSSFKDEFEYVSENTVEIEWISRVRGCPFLYLCVDFRELHHVGCCFYDLSAYFGIQTGNYFLKRRQIHGSPPNLFPNWLTMPNSLWKQITIWSSKILKMFAVTTRSWVLLRFRLGCLNVKCLENDQSGQMHVLPWLISFSKISG